MARSFRICNTSDDNEPLRIHMAFSDEPRDLKPGEVSGEYRLNAPKDEALSMRIESLDAPERRAPAFNDDGERVFPKVEVYWRADGETHPVDALKDELAKRDAQVAELKASLRQARLDKTGDNAEFNELHRQIRELKEERNGLAETLTRGNKLMDEVAKERDDLRSERDDLAEVLEHGDLERRLEEQRETILELLADRRKLDAVRNALR